MRVCVTGASGFIGQHVCRHFLSLGAEVMSFDCLLPQVHGASPDGRTSWPLAQIDVPGLTNRFGDCSDPMAFANALFAFTPDLVVHLAAKVGVGQSAYEIAPYVSKNVTGTAVVVDLAVRYNEGHRDNPRKLVELQGEIEAERRSLAHWKAEIEALVLRPADEIRFLDANPENQQTVAEYLETEAIPMRDRAQYRINEMTANAEQLAAMTPPHPIASVIVAGSMSSYGEGAYHNATGTIRGGDRYPKAMARGFFDIFHGAKPVGIPETEPLEPASVYAWTKAAAEEIALQVHRVRGLDVRVARFFNVFGPGQSLTNPYTGICAIFSARCMVGFQPVVYEDGGQLRDFVHVGDVARAIATIAEQGEAGGAYNVGTGNPRSVLDVARAIGAEFNIEPLIPVPAIWRVGDVRHCFADATKLRDLGWSPQVSFEQGIHDLIAWVRESASETEIRAIAGRAEVELAERGLLRATTVTAAATTAAAEAFDEAAKALNELNVVLADAPSDERGEA